MKIKLDELLDAQCDEHERPRRRSDRVAPARAAGPCAGGFGAGVRHQHEAPRRAGGKAEQGIARKRAEYELRFRSLFHEGRGYAFPCDADGHVDLDTLSDRARLSYFFARAVVGRDVSMPVVFVPDSIPSGQRADPVLAMRSA